MNTLRREYFMGARLGEWKDRQGLFESFAHTPRGISLRREQS
jgi:hypothetical protein